ncbi:MAG: AI-2E family transporter [Pseudomonadota bacterium]
MRDQEPGHEHLTGTAVDLTVRIGVLGLILAWCFVLLQPFIAVGLWGIVLAIALYPLFLRLQRLLWGSGMLATILMTVVGIAIILGPVSVMSASFVINLQAFATHLTQGTVNIPPPPPSVAEWPVIGQSVSDIWQLASGNLESLLTKYAQQVTSAVTFLLGLAANAGLTLLQFLLAIIIAGILMPQAGRMGDGLENFAARLTPSKGAAFIELARNTVRNVARGVIGVSVLQSLLIGIGFVGAGVPLAGILTLICLFLAIIQIGPGIVVIGSLIYVWMELDTLTAVLFTVWMVPAMLIDNVLRPILMSRGLPVPMVVILLGVLGGTLAHGLIGLFIGPVILAFGYDLLRAWTAGPQAEAEPEEKDSDSPALPPKA